MRIAVQKFGGTSVATEQMRQHAIQRIQEALEIGCHTIVVVSAMGRQGEPYATDTLLSLVQNVDPELPAREKDLLMSCGEIISGVVLTADLRRAGMDAVFLTGAQAGILTSEQFGEARILRVQPQRIYEELRRQKVVVVAGFQGINENGEITTLGRGGSDTTAVALGVAVNAETVDIFTDVEGVMTADPRLVTNAKVLSQVSYQEVCQLAQEGAKVIHPRAVEIAMQRHVMLRIRNTKSSASGTLICDTQGERGSIIDFTPDRLITGIAHVPHITQIKIDTTECQEPSKVELNVFQAMAKAGISVDFINVSPTAIIFTVHDGVAFKAIKILQEMSLNPNVVSGCAKVTVVGINMTGVPGVMAQIVQALNSENISILQSADSYTTIWCLVEEQNLMRAVNALHEQFCLAS